MPNRLTLSSVSAIPDMPDFYFSLDQEQHFETAEEQSSKLPEPALLLPPPAVWQEGFLSFTEEEPLAALHEEKLPEGFLFCFEEMQLKETPEEQGEACGHQEVYGISEGWNASYGEQKGDTLCILGTLYGLREEPYKMAIATAA